MPTEPDSADDEVEMTVGENTKVSGYEIGPDGVRKAK